MIESLAVSDCRRGLSAALTSRFSTTPESRRKPLDVPAQRQFSRFYRASYRISRPSVRPSVCLSVTLGYREHTGWTSSKVIIRIISLGSSLLGATTSPM